VLQAGTTQKATATCGPNETAIDSWSSLAFVTSERNSIVALLTPPPSLAHDGEVDSSTVVARHRVVGTIHTDKTLPFMPLAEVQIGAICAL
jgi:hypothetical protein